jgi:hypothetical protein
LFEKKLKNIGENDELICIFDEQNMQFYIYFMQDFGIKFYLIYDLFLAKNHLIILEIKVWLWLQIEKKCQNQNEML